MESTTTPKTLVYRVLIACHNAVRAGRLVQRPSSRDKEFAFQNWAKVCLDDAARPFATVKVVENGRNKFPDFILKGSNEGYEIKGLAYPGRERDFDANSKLPAGAVLLDGSLLDVFYIFGRYPQAAPNVLKYPIHDLVLAHGDFLNPDRGYVHKNFHIKGFGHYGDILIRDRKMYVAPTPYGLLTGVERRLTAIVPETLAVELVDPLAASELQLVGRVERVEAKERVLAYKVSLADPSIEVIKGRNPNAGRRHTFLVYAHKSSGRRPPVQLRPREGGTK